MKDIYAVYVRVSTGKQAEEGDSIEMQINLARKYVKENDGILPEENIFIEPAVSASKTELSKRSVLLQCLIKGEKGGFNKLLAYKRDRLARKAEDSLIIRGKLQKAGIDLIFTSTGDGGEVDLNDPYQKMIENIRSSIDELESVNTSIRVSDTMKDKAKRGEFSGGNLPYGYMLDKDRNIIFIESQRELIKEIEDLYLNGQGIAAIARWLNGESIRGLGYRPTGKAEKIKQFKTSSPDWTRDAIKGILFNHFYAGYLTYRPKSKPGEEKEEPIIEKGTHEAVRTEEKQALIDKTKNKRASKIVPPRFYTTTFLLSGLLFCKECGQKYYTRNSTRSTGSYSYYVCSSRQTHIPIERCPSPSFSREILEEYVVNNIMQRIKKVDLLGLQESIKKELNKKIKNRNSDLEEVEKKILKLEKNMEAIQRLLLELDPTDEFYEMMRDSYQDSQKKILTDLKQAKVLRETLKEKSEETVDTFQQAKTIYESLIHFDETFYDNPFHRQKAILESIIERIEINKEGKLDIILKIPLDDKVSEEISEVSFISFGGVGDTTTLILAPLVAALGIPVAKMSGRGLGHTGGTIDKLEAIPGYRAEVSEDEFIRLVNKNKLAIVGQSGNLAPADKKIYGLRDVTATVNAIPLIASSIMSKKIAAGADAIVLDVKVGSGAFMKTMEDASALADTMVEIGNLVGRKTMAVISDMSQPLGYAIGNALEVKEAIETLQGRGPADLTELCLVLGSKMAVLAQKAASEQEARGMLEAVIKNGKAFHVFKQFLAARGADVSVVDEPDKFPKAAYQIPVESPENGYVSAITADEIGTAAMLLGAGRATKESVIDVSVGVILHKKIGDEVSAGEPIATIHSNSRDVKEVTEKIVRAYSFSKKRPAPVPLIRR